MGISKLIELKKEYKMKFFALLEVALAERGEMSVADLKVATEEFAACAERDVNLDVTPFYQPQTETKDFQDCFVYFINAMYECTKIQAEHPFCVEDNPNYNPIMCAVKINQCCIEELSGIGSCM